LAIINRSGTNIHTSQPYSNFSGVVDTAWSPTDPDKYYYFNGTSLSRRNLAAQTTDTVKNFGSTLQHLGGSGNWIDITGRYFLIRFGDEAYVWDSQTDTLYANPVPWTGGGGWIQISPNGLFVIDHGNDHTSYAINHGTDTVSATGVMYADFGTDHSGAVSASDGTTYGILINGSTGTPYTQNGPGVYAVDVSVDRSAMSVAQQMDDSVGGLGGAGHALIPITFADAGHISGVSLGPFKNWFFFSPEGQNIGDGPDDFDAAPTNWYVHKQEIIAANVITLATKRICHHRSRGLWRLGACSVPAIQSAYEYMPKVSCSWDGSLVIWASNFNLDYADKACGYSDFYAVIDSLGAQDEGGGAPRRGTASLR
jgi:hypothetical protein